MASSNFPVAVIGMAVNLPAAKTCDEFWSMMINGRESVGQFPSKRALDIQHILQSFNTELLDRDNPFFTGSFFEEVDKFDPIVFQISEKEALYIEPEQRIFLQTVWEVLEDAGYASKIRGTKTGVYVGTTENKYKYILTENHPSISHGNHSPFIAARVAYVLDLKGPAMMVATACSSSLLSVHLACQGLLSHDCDMAIAGGVTLHLLPISTHTDILNQLGDTGPNLKCRPFDMSANGIAIGEGCGAVMLKPLAKAIVDGDHIYGVLEGTTANQDGHSNGITAPHPGAQASMLVQAWKLANITPDKISYFEAHGTGTELGDSIEISGITNAFKKCGLTFSCQSKCKIPIGSVKANVGHLADGAAGIVSLIKVLLCFKYNMIPPLLHFKEPNPHINWSAAPVFVNTCPISLALHKDDTPIYISVNCFGLVGTNVHAVVKRYSPDIMKIIHQNPCINHSLDEIHFIALAATSKWSLSEISMKMWHYFESKHAEQNSMRLKNICYTVNTGREQSKFQHRAIVFGSDWSKMSQSLKLLHCYLQHEFEGDSPNETSCEPSAGYATIYNLNAINREIIMNTGERGQLMLFFINGENISWDHYYSNACGQSNNYIMEKIPLLPTYAFEKVRYWPDLTFNHKPLNANYLALEYGTTGSVAEPRENDAIHISHADDRVLLIAKSIETTVQTALNEILNTSFDWSEHADEDLFSYGLDSTQINMLIKRELGVSFDFHLNPTYERIKFMIQEGLKSVELSESEHIEEKVSPKTGLAESSSLSFAQQRLWVMQELTNNHCIYNATNCLKITGEFHVSAFVAAVNSVLSSHDAFHIIFSERSCKPIQRLKNERKISIQEVNIETSHDTVMKLYSQDYKMPFDLQEGPLVRCVLYHLPDNSHYFTMVVHHIIFDGWSHFLFYNELWDKYTKIIEGKSISCQLYFPLFIQLADEEFASALSSGSNDLKYWKTVLHGDLPLTTLPGDKKRPAVFTHNGSRLTCVIDDTIIQSLRDLCDSKYTMFMILLSAVYTLIHSFTGEEDLIVGSPIARSHTNSKHVIGCFINTLALRLHIESRFNFKEVLESVFNVTLEALDHQSLPFNYLVNLLNLSRDTSITPVFSVNVCYHNAEIKSEHVDPPTETKVERIFLHNDSAKWDLNFDFLQEDHGMKFTLEYYQDIFSNGYAKHILDSFLSLLKVLIKQPSISLHELQFPSDESLVSVLHGDKKELGTLSLPYQLLESLKHSAGQSFILDFYGEKHTYGDVVQDAMRLAIFLRKTCMIGKQTRVGLLLDPSLESLKSILACIFSGLVYVPLNKDNPRFRQELICKEAQLKAVIFGKASLALANHLLWSCKTTETLICIDSEQYLELEENPLMDVELWHSVATSASNDIEGGGWKSSYTGEFISTEEMNEYSKNVLLKLRPYLSPSAHTLEIGCASGLTTKVLSPLVSRYVATDISQAMIDRLKEQLYESGNVETVCLPADQINVLFNGQKFDIIVLNSVVHCFPGHHYLLKVFAACEALLSENGIIFMGDIMDLDLKDKFIHSLRSFKENNPPKRVKTEWESELFLTRDFLSFLCQRSTKLNSISFSKKIYTILNELTEYRFDALYTTEEYFPSSPDIQQKMYAVNDIIESTKTIGEELLHETCVKIVQEVGFNDQAYILFTYPV